jgi:prephenate dehydrogenase
MKHVAIIGFGRFGDLLCDLLSSYYEIAVIESDSSRLTAAIEKGYRCAELKDLNSFDTIIFAVPISAFEGEIAKASQYITNGQLVMDICSVKVYPANVLKLYLPDSRLIATHPMFGPDSASKGLAGLQMAICPINAESSQVREVVAMWNNLGVETTLTTPEQHDHDSVLSQSFTYSLAKIVLGMNLSDVKLTTRSFKT